MGIKMEYHSAVLEEMMGPAKFVGFCFLLFAAFGAGYYYSNLTDAEPFLAYAGPVAAETCEVPPTLTSSTSDYCAILTMPRSLLPFLERLKSNRLAKDVVITPATVENDNGRLTAVAKEDAEREKIAAGRNVRPAPAGGEKATQKDSSILGAMAVYFLAGSKRQESP
jgi:hypothetical protein